MENFELVFENKEEEEEKDKKIYKIPCQKLKEILLENNGALDIIFLDEKESIIIQLRHLEYSLSTKFSAEINGVENIYNFLQYFAGLNKVYLKKHPKNSLLEFQENPKK